MEQLNFSRILDDRREKDTICAPSNGDTLSVGLMVIWVRFRHVAISRNFRVVPTEKDLHQPIVPFISWFLTGNEVSSTINSFVVSKVLNIRRYLIFTINLERHK